MKIKLNKAGLICSILHFAIVGYFIYNVERNSLIWIWMVLFPIDFPVSLLSPGGHDFMINLWGEPLYLTGWRESVYNSWTGFVHLIPGTIWWYYIPVLAGKIVDKIATKLNQSG